MYGYRQVQVYGVQVKMSADVWGSGVAEYRGRQVTIGCLGRASVHLKALAPVAQSR